MFQNSGKKIMGLMKVLFWLNVVIGIFGGVAGTLALRQIVGWSWAIAVVCGVVGTAVFCLVMYVFYLWLYSYGELVQSNIDQKELLEKLLIKSERPAPVVHREPAANPRVPANPEDVFGYEPARPVQREYSKPAVEMNPAYMGGAVLRPTPAVPVKGVIPPQVAAQTAQTAQPAPEAPAPAAEPAPLAPGVAPLVVYCNRCGGKHTPDAQTCRYCGNALR